MKIDIKDLYNKLNNNSCVEVKFKTKKGTIRTMNCTRLNDKPGIDNPKLNGLDIIAVFDHLVNEWRAFRKDSVIEFKVIDQ